ncbi:MAG: SGNH/GDSL hydrolase family protein [Flavobacteriaceae bacterium]
MIFITMLCLSAPSVFGQEAQSSFGTSIHIKPNDSALHFNGVLYSHITEKEAELHRYTEDFFKNGFDGTIEVTRARTQPGISISFKTNSPLIKLKFDKLENSQGRKRRFTVFKDESLVYDFISDLEFTIANPAKNTCEWEVYLPHFSGVKFLGLELSDGYTLFDLPKEEKPVYIAVGNSITHGVGQTGTVDTYPYQVADSLGFDYINLATGGSEISTETLRNFEDVSPRLISILWGYNDVTYEADPLIGVMPIYESLVSSLCSKFPEADIICISQTFTTTVVGKVNPDNRIESLRSWTKETVERLQKKYDNLFLLDGLKYAASEDDLKDRVHLNKQGARKLADGIVKKFLTNNAENE